MADTRYPSFDKYLEELLERKHFSDFWYYADDRWQQYVEYSVLLPAKFNTADDLERAYTAFVFEDLDTVKALLRYQGRPPRRFLAQGIRLR